MSNKKEQARRWRWRFGIKAVLLLLTLVCVLLALIVVPMKRQYEAVIELRALGATVRLADSPLDRTPYGFKGEEFPEPGMLTRLIHENLPAECLLEVLEVVIEPATTDLDRAFREVARIGAVGWLTIEADVSAKEFEHVVQREGVSDLSLGGTTHVSAPVLAQIGKMKHLESLVFHDQCTVEADGMTHLSQLSSLKTMFLRCKGIEDGDLKFLSGLKNLTWLEIELPGIDGSGLKSIDGLDKMERLELDGIPLDDDEASFLSTMPRLWSLGLDDSEVSDITLEALTHAKGLAQIGLERTRIVGSGLVNLREHPKLRSINLAGSPVTEGMQHLATCPELSTLSLSRTGLGDNEIAALAKSKSLETILVCETDVSIESIRTLLKIPSLRRIVHSIDKAHYKDIQAEFPDVDLTN